MDKRQLRKDIKARVKLLSKEQKDAESQVVFHCIEDSDIFMSSNNVMLFASLPDEIPTHSVIERWAQEKNVFLPRVKGEELEIIKYEPNSLQQGSYDIMEPMGVQTFDPSALDLVIVPGVAFDHHGNRLGHGKGFYDRFLGHTRATTIAVCFDCQLVDFIPTEPHDLPAQHVVTKSFSTLP